MVFVRTILPLFIFTFFSVHNLTPARLRLPLACQAPGTRTSKQWPQLIAPRDSPRDVIYGMDAFDACRRSRGRGSPAHVMSEAGARTRLLGRAVNVHFCPLRVNANGFGSSLPTEMEENTFARSAVARHRARPCEPGLLRGWHARGPGSPHRSVCTRVHPAEPGWRINCD